MSSDPQDPALTRTPVGPRYWRSLDELGDTPGFREWLYREFPQGASEAEGVDRRHFLRIMTASFALGGLGMAGCRRPESNIRPYAKQPERVMPGVPVHYASSQPRAHGNIPLVVQTYQNRPTKLEGNPGYEPFGAGPTPRRRPASSTCMTPTEASRTTRVAAASTPRR
jgi:molybdopterin-containing oxidoreductase family iron-sulfur binding subunit